MTLTDCERRIEEIVDKIAMPSERKSARRAVAQLFSDGPLRLDELGRDGMTLTDREIAILHLALGHVALASGSVPTASDFDYLVMTLTTDVDQCEGLSACDEAMSRALAMVPLYRHAFGIEAPGEGTVVVLVLEWDDETLLESTSPASPASLAIANALSKTRL